MNKTIAELLDIYIITFNRSKSLDKTLEQILNKVSPIKDFEIKIIDNNSSDNTSLIIQKWQKNHPNIKYIKNKYNIGGNANIVKAFLDASKQYVWVLCDDDEYQWDSWNEVELAIYNNESAIVVGNTDEPQINIVQLFAQTSFVPGVIYKTSLIDAEVIDNMTYNISNMFPHMAISAKLINENFSFKIISKEIVIYNSPDIFLEQTYTRGVLNENLHPFRKNLMYLAGYANTTQLIKDKNLRNNILCNRRFYKPSINSVELFALNDIKYNGSSYNLTCIFLALNFWSRVKFLLNFFIYKIFGKIFYIYKSEYIDKKTNNIIIDYRVKIFSIIKTKLFKRRCKIGAIIK